MSQESKDDSAPKSDVEKPPSTPEMSARDVEEMADAMLRNSPLPDAGRTYERLLEGSGSDKLPEEGVMRSFLRRKVARSCLNKPLQVNL